MLITIRDALRKHRNRMVFGAVLFGSSPLIEGTYMSPYVSYVVKPSEARGRVLIEPDNYLNRKSYSGRPFIGRPP